MKNLPVMLLMSVFATNDQPKENFPINAPAVYYAVLDRDSVLYEYSHGNLSVCGTQPVNENSQFALFSITKVFTSIAIMQLEERGKLKLDDPASGYLPQYPFLENITIRQLLSHQSGLNNPIPVSWIHLEEEDKTFNYQKFSTEILRAKAKNKSLPGTKASYSNLNYLLLGEIIEKVAGEDYKEYIKKSILPGNEGIGFRWDSLHAVTGYNKSGLPGLQLSLLVDKKKYTGSKTKGLIPFKKVCLNGSAYGGLMASPRGLNKFLQEFLKTGSPILSEKSKAQLFTGQPLKNGKPSGHTPGWFSGKLGNHNYVHHAGGGGGFYLELRIYPELGIATYLLTNLSGFSDRRILDKTDGEFIKMYKPAEHKQD